jgi:hypothetical protein
MFVKRFFALDFHSDLAHTGIRVTGVVFGVGRAGGARTSSTVAAREAKGREVHDDSQVGNIRAGAGRNGVPGVQSTVMFEGKFLGTKKKSLHGGYSRRNRHRRRCEDLILLQAPILQRGKRKPKK